MSETLQSLEEKIQKVGYTCELQIETNQLAFAIKQDDLEFPAFARLYSSNDLLQLIVFIPTNYKTGRAPDTARLLHLLNKQLEIPGFGMEEEASIIFFRMMLPFQGVISQELLERSLKILEATSIAFAPVITSVAQGAMTFQEIAQKARQFQQASS